MTERLLAAIATDDSTGASDAELDAAASVLGIEMPEDYRAVLRRANGVDVGFGESWIKMWRVEELVENNAGYQAAEFDPGLVIFGSNGAGEAYAWDLRERAALRYVVVPFLFEWEEAVPMGRTFEEFVEGLHRGIPFDQAGT